MSDSVTTLFVIDDDIEVATLISVIAERAGFKVATICDSTKVFDALEHCEPDAIVLDLQMPGLDGIEVLRALAEREAQSGILLVSGMDERIRAAAETFGSEKGLRLLGTMQKPFDPEELLQALRAAFSAAAPLTPAHLQTAIHEEQLLLVYQPTVKRTRDGDWEVASMEALLRWDHPERGLLGPSEFLAMGESSGLIGPMTDFVIHQGLMQLKAWQSRQIGLGLRLNISASLLTDVEFPDRFETLIGELELDPSTVTLEVTETVMLDQHPNTFDILTRFRLKQVNLAIDDFGIGYSSLTQLFRMPFNEMKIDKSLLQQVPQSSEARIMVEALVELAHNLNLTVCAEGVESQEVLDYLRDIGCDSAQGFFIGRPILPKDVENILEIQSPENSKTKTL
ncbi:MAG: EAL domain-containing response regulator [Gammaproteobacteria bacterium]|nr:EAL domain-containing response regulator [Gammaproteobacteria bacterium]